MPLCALFAGTVVRKLCFRLRLKAVATQAAAAFQNLSKIRVGIPPIDSLQGGFFLRKKPPGSNAPGNSNPDFALSRQTLIERVGRLFAQNLLPQAGQRALLLQARAQHVKRLAGLQ